MATTRRFGLIGHTLIVLSALAADQLSKFFFVRNLSGGRSYRPLPFLDFRLELNRGCAFSLFDQEGLMIKVSLCLLAVFVVAIFSFLAINRIRDGQTALGESLIIAGGLGNLIDRLTLGVVIDFIHLHVASFHWPTFNLADCLVVLGVALVIKRTLK
jgi:signal peptidase II